MAVKLQFKSKHFNMYYPKSPKCMPPIHSSRRNWNLKEWLFPMHCSAMPTCATSAGKYVKHGLDYESIIKPILESKHQNEWRRILFKHLQSVATWRCAVGTVELCLKHMQKRMHIQGTRMPASLRLGNQFKHWLNIATVIYDGLNNQSDFIFLFFILWTI